MIQLFPGPEALADAVARHVFECARAAITDHDRFIIALSGGSTPKAAYSRLADESRVASRQSRVASEDWRRFHILWTDERCVPPDDPRSNYRMAKDALLDRVPIPAQNIHRIRGEDEPERAAQDYEDELRALLEDPARSFASLRMTAASLRMTAASLRMTGVDLVLLGLGEDGHTASLFPGQPAVHETTRWVLPVPLPPGSPLMSDLSPAVARVTLTPAFINSARNVTFVVSGASKAGTLQRVLEGPRTPDLLPAQAIHPGEGRLSWLVDEAAGAFLSAARIST